MTFKLSKRSLKRLQGVNQDLIDVVNRAIVITEIDFGISEGLRTIVQPAARAGATLQAIWLSGQFQGVIMPTTPTGSRTTTAEPTFSSKG